MRFTFAVLVSFIVSAIASASKLPKQNLLSGELVTKLQNTVRQKGCSINICYAIDGSNSIHADNFDRVKIFVEIVSAILDADNGVEYTAKYAATQFGDSSETISPLTGDLFEFSQALDSAKPNGDSSTAIGAGIEFCDGQLSPRSGHANKMVVITDGVNTAGADPVSLADSFRHRHPNGDLCVVGIGASDSSKLLEIAGGDPKKVFSILEYFDLAEAMLPLIHRVCE